jgi:hypothetical protein
VEWIRCLNAVDGSGAPQHLALFPADREIPVQAQGFGVQVRLDATRLERPCQRVACWLFTELCQHLHPDAFWRPLLPNSREVTSWYHTLVTSCAYRLLAKLVAHKAALFTHLQERWRDLFGASFDVLLYDLTSTYFESDPAESPGGLRRFGYSWDKRSDCVQVVIALVVTRLPGVLSVILLPKPSYVKLETQSV